MENPVNQEAIIDFTDQVNRIADNDSSSLNKRELYLSRILVVDDDPLNVDVLEEILTGSGYSKVVTTTDPLEAVQFYKESNFDLVLLDILMPIMDGFGVMEQFKSMRKKHEVPVLILSALSDQKTRLKALEGGARDYLIKPFNPDEVLVRIRNLLEVRLAQKQLRMHNEILDQKVKERTKELEETRLEIIHQLGRAAEYRDNETGLHIIRMSQYSQAIAKIAGLSERETDLLLHASPMHDIGKIGIPDNILLKPGKLEKDEWEVMKTHTIIGANILRGHNSNLIQTALSIALTHHEKWNGAGYPNGLSKEEIPLTGRIVAIADTFDALTSIRPYKEAWPVEKTVAVMEAEIGEHYDPGLMKVFKACLPTFLDIKEQFQDKKLK